MVLSIGTSHPSPVDLSVRVSWSRPCAAYTCHWIPGSESGQQVSIGSDNRLSPIRRQATIWTSAGSLSIGPLGTNFSQFFYKNIKLFIHRNAYRLRNGGHFVQGRRVKQTQSFVQIRGVYVMCSWGWGQTPANHMPRHASTGPGLGRLRPSFGSL